MSTSDLSSTTLQLEREGKIKMFQCPRSLMRNRSFQTLNNKDITRYLLPFSQQGLSININACSVLMTPPSLSCPTVLLSLRKKYQKHYNLPIILWHAFPPVIDLINQPIRAGGSVEPHGHRYTCGFVICVFAPSGGHFSGTQAQFEERWNK